MFKRTILILVVLAGAGTVIWLSRSFKVVKAESMVEGRMLESNNPARQAGDLSDERSTGTEVPESARHAADAIERHRQASLAGLDQAIRNQEAKVEERRKVLATIVRTKGIIYKGPDASYAQSGANEAPDPKSALQTFHQLEQEKMQLESQIGSLLKYDNDQLMVYAAGLDLPDNIIKNLLPLYQQAKRDLEALKINGVGEKHPTMISAVEQIDAMKRQLDEGVVNLRATLKAKLDLATEHLKSVEAMKEKAREEAIKRGADAQDYVNAKRDFETDQQLLQELKLKQESGKAKEKAGR